MKKTFFSKFFAVAGLAVATIAGLQSISAHADENRSKVLYIYNWTEYIPQQVLNEFTKETGIQVRYSTYQSNEELYSKLKLTGGKGYDLIFPSSYYIKLLETEKLIQPIDHSKVNIGNIIPSLLGRPYDPKNTYSLPYMYGFTAIGVNTDYIPADQITSWRDLWNPKYQNLILLDDVQDDFSMALLSRGINPNKADKAQIDRAYQDLRELLPRVVQFNSDSPEVPYLEGTSNLGMIWSGSAFRAEQENPAIKIVYPKEGAILWIDNFAIPTHAQNLAGAYKFINFILQPKIAYQITQAFGFQTSNSKVKALFPKAWQDNPALFPDESVYKKAIINNIPISKLDYYNKLYNELRVQ